MEKRPGLAVWLMLATLAWAGIVAAQAPRDALQRHMAAMLTDGDEWRTPNPDYEAGTGAPAEFGLTMRLSPDGSHVTGLLRGIHADGRSANYWTLLALYNPVTEKVVTQQIGWDGTLLRGEVPLQFGDEQTVDMIRYGADGTMKIVRHVQRFDGDRHTSAVFERDAHGEWAHLQAWTWQRYELDDSPDPPRSADGPGAGSGLADAAGHLLSGSGRWVADNPGYTEDGDEPEQFGMNYRWGMHGHHIVGEIVSLYADGRSERDWTIYITHNPVTGRTFLEQTGANGVYFRGELHHGDGAHAESGLIYLPNGQVKSVRDETELLDANTRIARVFERDPQGRWKKVREWTWRQVP